MAAVVLAGAMLLGPASVRAQAAPAAGQGANAPAAPAAASPAPRLRGAPTAAPRAAAARAGDHIVAVVNTELVTSVEVAQRAARTAAELRRAGAPVPAAAELQQQALESLIDERVQLSHARDSGYRVDEAEIDRAVANVAAQNQLTVAQLRDRMRSEGMEMARFRSNLRDQIMVERVREREVVGRIRVAEDEVDRLLDEQRVQLGSEVQLRLAQILVGVPEGAPEPVVAERRARIDAALARVRAGADFAQVARELSEDGNREAGGDIGLRPASRLPDLFVEAVKGLAVGDVTPQPLRSGAGFHLLKLLDRQDTAGFRITQTRARHILLRVPEGSAPAAVAARLDGLRRQIERGELRFEAVAQQISEDGSAAAGGELGWASPGQFVPEFEQAMDKLPPGGLSAPVVSRFGVHLIQVLERRETQVDPKTLREQARAQLRERKFEPAYLDWVKELRLRAYIEMREPPQ